MPKKTKLNISPKPVGRQIIGMILACKVETCFPPVHTLPSVLCISGLFLFSLSALPVHPQVNYEEDIVVNIS